MKVLLINFLHIWVTVEIIWASLLGNRYTCAELPNINPKENQMNVVLIVPTGIGAAIGGHAGDANPVAKLIGSCCDRLITHPNVVNASDINEMPENTLYVEGSMLDRFLEGKLFLKRRKMNRILVAANKPLKNETINAVSAGRSTIGVSAEILELKTPLEMTARMENGIATGDVSGWFELVEQVSKRDFDALAIHTPINVDRDVAINYYRLGGINPWGGVEAKASRMIAEAINKPVAHAPLENASSDDEELFFIYEEVIDPRIAPEALSSAYLHCVLKGLSMAPRISFDDRDFGVGEIDFMVSPARCFGRPHRACVANGIPIIYVNENNSCICDDVSHDGMIEVDNYIEAAGIIMCEAAGVDKRSVRRPLSYTKIIKEGV